MELLDTTSTALTSLTHLVDRLNGEGIRYCHWKSTCRLDRSLQGRTDFDILVGRSDAARFKQILDQCDYKAFVSHPSRQFPGIEDYLGFDAATGRLIHLHVHYRLVLGEQFVKNYYLPLEASYLEHTQERLGVKVPAPELELCVLVLRALLKYRDRDALRDILARGTRSGIPDYILDELRYLRAQTSDATVVQALDQYCGFVSADAVLAFLKLIDEAPRAGWRLLRLRGQVRRDLAPFQRYSRLRAQARYFHVMLIRQWPFDRVLRRLLPLRDKHKIPASGGLTIAFVGADGAGKSTVIQQVTKWLGWRMVVRSFYMGSSQPSRPTRAVKGAFKLARRLGRASGRLLGERHGASRALARLARGLEHVRFLADGRDRYTRYRVGSRKAAQGAVVIYDRYPMLSAHVGERPMDGPRIPLLQRRGAGRLARRMASAEAELYRRILPADHTFVLQVSPEVSQARKPEHDRATIAAKRSALEQLPRSGSALTVIDADQPLDDVLLQIKARIWSLL